MIEYWIRQGNRRGEIATMSQFVISDIEDATIEQLRLRAAAHGRTAEIEAKEILQQGVQGWRAALAFDHFVAAGALT